MKKLKLLTVLLTTLLLVGCQSILPTYQGGQTLLQDPQIRQMAAEHPAAAKKVWRYIYKLEGELERR